jgi:long-chain acyl-CoA synthetase
VQAALPARYRTSTAVAMQGEMLSAMRHPPPSMNIFRRWLEIMDYYLVTALFNVFPLPQQSGFRQSFSFAGESADRGYSIVVFPEGRRTQTGELSPFRSGIGLLALRLGLPVLPMKIEGLFELKMKRQHFAKPGTVTVKIGTPMRFPPDADPEQMAAELQRAVAGL